MHLTGFEQRRHFTPVFYPIGDSGEGEFSPVKLGRSSPVLHYSRWVVEDGDNL
jgi:hypothetical protein